MNSSKETTQKRISTLKHLAYVLKVNEEELSIYMDNEVIQDHYLEHQHIKVNKETGLPLLDKFGNPKVRVINPSIKRLKVIQKKILVNVLNDLPIPIYAYGGIKKRDNVLNAKPHLKHKYKFVTDLRNFFPSITNKMVYRMFINMRYSPDVARCLTRLTTYKGHVPQGGHCSSIITNLVFQETGNILYEFSLDNNITFTSFVDDLTFSSSNDFKHLIPFIKDILYQGGYILSHNKTFYKKGNVPITGVYCQHTKLLPLNPFLDKLNKLEEFTEQQQKGLLMYKQKIENANKRKKIKKEEYTEIV